ncbi:MAG: DUF1566 domain-containing protein [Sulfurovum sp.]
MIIIKRVVLMVFIVLGVVNAEFIRDDSKDVVLDTSTHLMWQDDVKVGSDKLNWPDAISYCESSTIGGYEDWHLPNFNELFNLVDRARFNPAMPKEFINIRSDYYLTSTTHSALSIALFAIYLYNGTTIDHPKSDVALVTCVRDE